MNPKKCKICGAEYQAFQIGQKVCGVACSIEYAKQTHKKEHKKRTRQMKKAFNEKDRSYWLKAAQTAFNAYVRERDKGKPCISCDKPDDGSHQRHASHFKSVGSNSALRFNLWNVHASCAQCNNWKSGNIGEYTPRLIAKIGQERYDWLVSQNQPVRHEIEYLKRLKQVFMWKIKRLKDARNID